MSPKFSLIEDFFQLPWTLTYGAYLWSTTIKTILVFMQLVLELSLYTVELVVDTCTLTYFVLLCVHPISTTLPPDKGWAKNIETLIITRKTLEN